jgi:hypothetical protein
MDGHVRLGGLQQPHDGRGAAEEVEPTVVGGNIICEGGTGEEVAQFVVTSTKPVSRWWALKPTHRLISTFDATVILL